MIKLAIIGASGYTGCELMRLLSHNPDMEVKVVTSRQNRGLNVLDVFPHLVGCLKDNDGLTFEGPDYKEIVGRVDAAFTALPHKTAMEAVAEFHASDVPVVDLSADFRFNSVSTYETWYTQHSKPELIPNSVYGLPELYREEIKTATIIGNPGCYPTGPILGLYPLIKKGVVKTKNIIIDSKSGVSGAGRNPDITTLYTEISEGLHAYKVGNHRHTPEIAEHLTSISGSPVDFTFTPHLVPINRGILTTIYTELKDESLLTGDILELFRSFYKDEVFVRVLPDGVLPDTAWVRGSNFIDIGVKVISDSKRLIVFTALDNLVKGAAGQAIQNMNILFNIKEDTGLLHIPVFP